jgi:radical SAM superfamily enzyme YgiQ (UPF0313 family)
LVCFGRTTTNELDTPEENFSSFFQVIDSLKPDIVGISLLFSGALKIALDLAKSIRQRNSEIMLIFGGQHVTLCPESVIEHADAVCVGEGEQSTLSLMNAISRGEDYETLENFHFNTHSHLVKNLISPLQDVNKIPRLKYFPENEFYLQEGKMLSGSSYLGTITNTLIYLCSRGCPFDCSYCSSGILRNVHGSKRSLIERKNIDRIIEDLKSAKDLGCKYIVFSDRIFPWKEEWINEFSSKYREYVNLPFSVFAHPGMVKPQNFKRLLSAGLNRVTLGIQSGSERIRKDIYSRTDSNEKIIQTSRIFSELGIRANYDLILDNPYENEEDYQRTLELLLQLGKPFQVHLHTLAFFPKTHLTTRALRDGKITQNDIEGYCTSSLSLNEPQFKNRIEKEYFYLYRLTENFLIPRKLIRALIRIPYSGHVMFVLSRTMQKMSRKIRKVNKKWLRRQDSGSQSRAFRSGGSRATSPRE